MICLRFVSSVSADTKLKAYLVLMFGNWPMYLPSYGVEQIEKKSAFYAQTLSVKMSACN